MAGGGPHRRTAGLRLYLRDWSCVPSSVNKCVRNYWSEGKLGKMRNKQTKRRLEQGEPSAVSLLRPAGPPSTVTSVAPTHTGVTPSDRFRPGPGRARGVLAASQGGAPRLGRAGGVGQAGGVFHRSSRCTHAPRRRPRGCPAQPLLPAPAQGTRRLALCSAQLVSPPPPPAPTP